MFGILNRSFFPFRALINVLAIDVVAYESFLLAARLLHKSPRTGLYRKTPGARKLKREDVMEWIAVDGEADKG